MPAAAPFDPLPPAPDIRFRRFDDIDEQRREIYDRAKAAITGMKLPSNATHRIELADVDYDGPFEPAKSDEKKMLMQGASLHRPLKATFRLIRQDDDQVVDEQRGTVARIPHLNSRGLFIRNGVVWSLRNQARLRPGIYTRNRSDGATETHFNVKPGSGRGFRLFLEPDTGVFKLQIGQSSTRFYPLLRQLGIPDDKIKEMWGEELFNSNYRARSGKDINELTKVVRKLGPRMRDVDEDLAPEMLREVLERIQVDPEVTELTVGEQWDNLNPDRLLKTTAKILAVSRGDARPDNRDSQAFQSIHSAEDFIHERLNRDQVGALRRLLYKASREGRLGAVANGLLDKNIGSLFEGTGLAMAVEDVNPFEIHDQRQAVTRLGTGGISSEQAVSRGARGVQASYLGVIDPVRGPESSKLGLDLRVTDAALKGSDNQLYTKVLNPKTGEQEIVSARSLSGRTVTFPGEMDKPGKRVPAIRNDEIQYVPREEVDYVVPSAGNMISRATAMIPFPEAIKGQRLLMGSRMMQQSMPLREPEAPLVQTADDDGNSLYDKMSEVVGASRAPVAGTVLKVSGDEIVIATPDGEKKSVSLFDNYPAARKTVIHNTPVVKKGDYVEPGQLLARSNFTDDKGTAAVGRNLRVAFMSAEGDTIEDAFVISESAAQKLTSEALYKTDLDLSDVSSTEKGDYRAIFSDKYKADQYDKLDEHGVIRQGAEVQPGDPLILGIGEKQKRAVGAVMKSPRSSHTDRALEWEHHAPGVVTDVARTRSGIKVAVKSYDTARAADKLSARYGNKGVISRIIPDEQMPTDESGQPIEVIANALGVVSRVNPALLAETLLGKVAAKTGKPYVLKGFGGKDVADFALKEALKHGVIREEDGKLIDTETLTDPRDGRKINNVFTGISYFMKPQHMAEGKIGARDISGYTAEGMPARGGREGSKRIAMLDTHALLSAGATEFLRDAKLIRGQRNDDYWRAVRMGEDPAMPTEDFADDHFKELLRAAGVNLRTKGSRTGLSPLLDEDVDEMAQHEIENPRTFNFETMKPIPGGLFDPASTGGAEGTRWAKISLPQKVPHPLFIEPIQKLLGLTRKQLTEVLAGKDKFRGKTGPQAIESALADIDIDRETNLAVETIKNGRKTHRDNAVKRLNYLTGLKRMEVSPDQLMVSKIPVIPPRYRPISSARGMDVIHDLNYLYHDLLESRNNYAEAQEVFGDAGDEYMSMWNAVQAISGVREPITEKSAEQGVKGVLRNAIGVRSTPKRSFYQRKLIGSSVDTVGRGAITADKNLDMDEVGVPKDIAWKTFRPFVIRRLVRQGMPATEALEAVRAEKKVARMALEQEMSERPVVYNRAPALHRYAYVGAWGKLRDDDAIGMPYETLKGIGGDFDGDQVNIHVPASDDAVEDVKQKMMPSKNLWFTGDFETHIEPMQDYLAGLYLASTPDDQQKPRTFATKEDAERAFARGEITMRTPIRILS